MRCFDHEEPLRSTKSGNSHQSEKLIPKKPKYNFISIMCKVAVRKENGKLDWLVLLLLVALPLLQLSQEYVGYLLMMTIGSFYTALTTKDEVLFQEIMLKFSGYLCLIIPVTLF